MSPRPIALPASFIALGPAGGRWVALVAAGGMSLLLCFCPRHAMAASEPIPARKSSSSAAGDRASAQFHLADPALPERQPTPTNSAPARPRPSLAATDEHTADVSTNLPHFDSIGEKLASPNLLVAPKLNPRKVVRSFQEYQQQLETARQMRRAKDLDLANKILVSLLENDLPPEYKRSALLEMALVAQDAGKLPRAQQIFGQYIHLFPQDPTVPEVLLRQGLLYRQMGANQLAIAKCYAVMSTALNLKLDQFDYYKRLVLQAQTEIADTYYLQGKFADAADFFTRLLKQNSTELNTAVIRYKLLRCLSILERHPQTVALAEEYVENHPDTAELPEVRFLLASSLKAMGRNRESMQQVLRLLAAQSESATANPEIWNYWKQKAGNEIANDLYRDGDYLHALEIYLALAEISSSPNWQLPVLYQIGLVYEHLHQRQKAIEQYDVILGREKELTGPVGTPGLKALVDMARWRKEHLTWLDNAIVTAQALKLAPAHHLTTNAAPRPAP